MAPCLHFSRSRWSIRGWQRSAPREEVHDDDPRAAATAHARRRRCCRRRLGAPVRPSGHSANDRVDGDRIDNDEDDNNNDNAPGQRR